MAEINVLLVDDEEDYVEVLAERLNLRALAVRGVTSGELALKALNDQPVDVVVLDVSMPGMGGGKCLTELLKINPEARVIISSGYSLDGPLQDILSSGASGFVSKPFSISNLLIAIRQVLGQ